MAAGESRVSQEFCPKCGTARVGAFRYCRSCGLDFDLIPPPASPGSDPEVAGGTLWAAKPGARSSSRARKYLVVGGAAILGLGALSNLTGPSAGITTASPTTAAVGATDTPRPPTNAPTDQPTLAPAAPALALAPTGDLEAATVVRVTDGDTIVVAIDGEEYRVRYIGMDTPEPNSPDPAIQAMAAEATAANEALVAGREVQLETDVSETDRYDRLLRNVWVETDAGELVMVGHELVRQGVAQVSTYPPDVRWVDHLLAAQEDARNGAIGLWAPQPTPSPSPQPTPEPTPAPTALALLIDDPMTAGTKSDGHAAFRGERGYYTYSAVMFPESYATLTWDVRGGDNNCYLDWALDPEGTGARSDRIGVRAGDRETGKIRFRTKYNAGEMDFKSTCPRWLVSLVGDTPPPPTPRPTQAGGGGGGNCHPSYRGACLKRDSPDYDCASGQGNGPDYLSVPVQVVGPDVFDLDSDNDGIGCDNE